MVAMCSADTNYSLTPGLPIRRCFPLFSQKDRGPHYLDSAASSQKPAAVINRMTDFLSNEHANIHRGAYRLSEQATAQYDSSKEKIAKFIGAQSARDIVFTKGATESINLVAHSIAHKFRAGDNILISLLEHHSNIVPWQLLCARRELNLHFVNITSNAEFDLEDYQRKLTELKPKLVSMTHVANSFGSVLPVDEIVALAHKAGAMVLIDAAQSVHHCGIDCRKLGVDFLAFSGHKMYGPTGIGVLYVRRDIQDQMQPFQGGGDMISSVTVAGSTWAEFPQILEAGTPPIAEAIALGTAVEFIESIGFSKIAEHEKRLFEAAWELLARENDLTLYGPAALRGADSPKHSSIIAFNLKGVHAHDLSTVADTFNVQVRAGHHCAMPALKHIGIDSSARASLAVYSDISDFEALIEAVRQARGMFL